MTDADGRADIPLAALARLYGGVAIALVGGLALLAYLFLPTNEYAGTEVSVTVFADVRELRVEELPRSMTTVFEQPTVLDRANRALARRGFTPLTTLERTQTDFEPIEGTPFAQVVSVDSDPERAEVVAVALADALVDELNAIGPTFGRFEVLPQLLVEDRTTAGLTPVPRAIVALLAAVLATAGIFIVLLAVVRPAVHGVQLRFPSITVVNTARSRQAPELADLIGSGRVAELITPLTGPVYLASQPSPASIRRVFASRLAGRLGVDFVDDPALAERGKPAIGELELSASEDVGHRLVGQDARVVLLAPEGTRLRPLLALADQFPPDSIVGLVIERRAHLRAAWRHVVHATSSDGNLRPDQEHEPGDDGDDQRTDRGERDTGISRAGWVSTAGRGGDSDERRDRDDRGNGGAEPGEAGGRSGGSTTSRTPTGHP